MRTDIQIISIHTSFMWRWWTLWSQSMSILPPEMLALTKLDRLGTSLFIRNSIASFFAIKSFTFNSSRMRHADRSFLKCLSYVKATDSKWRTLREGRSKHGSSSYEISFNAILFNLRTDKVLVVRTKVGNVVLIRQRSMLRFWTPRVIADE
jgi:hypothetical protein